MPRCPKCRRHFRVLEDEDDGQHDCPHCGYGAHDDDDDTDDQKDEPTDD